ERRKQIYQEVHKIIYAEQPACFLYFPYDFYAISARFQNTAAYFTLNMPTYTIKDWYIQEQ
ncbi:MAG: peptide-binding protein, partial [Candidatus Omnitrophica bacterium]|nr:peptide-binding protein [Candidatus Omnitrophota bacterium]